MPVSDMCMLIYLNYARAYALLKKAFCYAQKGQICLKLCGHYGPKPSYQVGGRVLGGAFSFSLLGHTLAVHFTV